MDGLRAWQADALDKYLRRPQDFLCVATPGAGKTRFALAAAARLIERGDIGQVIVVVPTSHLRAQWASAAAKAGIQLDPGYANGVGPLARDYDGMAVTYGSVASAPLLYRKLSTAKTTLVILDEVHHAGDSKAWGDSIRNAFDAAASRLCLSGTPFRSDGTAIPFVRYDDEAVCEADYIYDYGAALGDGDNVVRQIEFHAFDGEARWRDAYTVESKIRLSDVDDETRANALRSALMPEGEWIPSVLRQADAMLSTHREQTPDAGGLVVAADQYKARRYADMLREICGEEPTLAISDEDGSSDRIAAFGRGRSRWIVAVAMVSEGVDIPRLAVGVYATNVSAELFFRQVVGRFVRTRDPEDYTIASLYIPSVPPLLTYAAEIEHLIPKALKEAVEKGEREAKSETTQLELNIVTPLGSGEAVHLATILSGERFTEAELRKAEEMVNLAGLGRKLTAAEAARLMRMMTGGRTLGTTTIEIPRTSLHEEKRQVRKLLTNRVNVLAKVSGMEQKAIFFKLNQICDGGKAVTIADLDKLKFRLETVNRWIVERG